MLRVIRGLKASSPITIKATFLGAHAVPPEYKSNRKGYVDLIINQMIPRVADEGLADFIDVFCDKGFFTPEETDRILDAGSGYGLIPKIHANELGRTGGVPVAVKYNSLSVDHLEFIDDNDIKALLNIKHSSFNIHHSLTMPTLLPSTAFFLGLNYSPARRIIESGLPVALASDFNPGTSPSGNMQFVMSLACIKLRLTPEEAINAATLNSAYAMGVSNSHGSIAVGKSANIFITKEIPSYQFMPYSYGNNKVESVILNGKLL
jgi:imidazolonepropionase